MTSRLVDWPGGIGIVDEDLQRMADTLSTVGDTVTEGLTFPGEADGANAIKRVRPLLDELRPAPDAGGGSPVPSLKSPRILGVEAAYYDGVTIGRVRVNPCIVDVFAASPEHEGQAVALSAKLTAALTAAVHASSVAGRVDTVYLSVRMNAPSGSTFSRRMKDTTTGVVTTQSVVLYTDPEVTVAIAAGTDGSSTPGAVPADGAGVYNVAVCTVHLPAAYTSGGVLLDGGGSFIRQVWERGGVRAQALETVRAGSMAFTANADAGPAGNKHTLLGQSQRMRGSDRVRAVFRHTAALAVIVLDDALWWCMREVRLTVLRSPVMSVVAPFGEYVPPSLATEGGASMSEDSGWVFSGNINDVGAGTGAFFATTGPPVMKFFARNSDGALVCTIADAPLHVDGDFYTVIAEALDQSLEG